MRNGESIGDRLRRLRRGRGLTQEQLSEQAAVELSVIQKLEQGRRSSARADTFVSLAAALDVELSELIGKRPHLDVRDDARVLGLRDLLIDPSLLIDAPPPDHEPVPIEQLEAAVSGMWDAYWAGRFSDMAARLPAIVAEARTVEAALGSRAAPLLAQAYELVASLLVHLGKDDLAAIAAERAIDAAASSDDQLLWAALHGTYSWTLLHQGRTEASERHAMWVAEQIEPSISKATLPHLTVWGAIVLWAMAAAVAGGRGDAAIEYIGLARSAAGRFVRGDRHDYHTNFGNTQVAMQTTHAYTMLREPGPALAAAVHVHREDLLPISWGRHLIDVAQAHIDARDLTAAEHTLLEADSMSPEWFRHQGPARAMVRELVEDARTLSRPLRDLARSVGMER